MNNPANVNSQAAKKAGLSYWAYMAKTYPGSVQAYEWTAKAKKGVKKGRVEVMQDAMSRMRGKIGMKFLTGIRGLVSGRG